MAKSPELDQQPSQENGGSLYQQIRNLAGVLEVPAGEMYRFKQKDYGTYLRIVEGTVKQILAGVELEGIIQQAKFGPEHTETGLRVKFPGFLPLADVERVVLAIFKEVTDPNQSWGS